MSLFNAKLPPATVRRRSLVNEGDQARALKNLLSATLGMTTFCETQYGKQLVVPKTVADPLQAAIADASRVLGLMGMLP